MVTMLAVVVDLSSLRYDRRHDRAAADAGATAGAAHLIGDTSGPFKACGDAWAYTVRNLGGDPASAPSPCAPVFPNGVQCDPAAPHAATATYGDYTITITNPVVDNDTLMKASSIGGSITQPVNAAVDGDSCDRLAVDVARRSTNFFGRIAGMLGGTDVHSVARYDPESGVDNTVPGLVALDPHGCASIDAGTGWIEVFDNGDEPASIAADSDAAAGCGGNPVLLAKNSGRIIAHDGTTGGPGELGYVRAVPPGQAYDASRPGSYIGHFVVRQKPVTREPVDRVYHCSLVVPACPGGTTDPIADLQSRYASGAPQFSGPYSTFPGPAQSCNNPPSSFAQGNWLVNCPTFNVHGRQVEFGGGGAIVFAGAVSIDSNSALVVNTFMSSGHPALDATTGLPVLGPSHADTTVVMRGALSLQSSTASLVMANTVVYQTVGGADLQGGPDIHWSAPATVPLRGLLYWNESGDQVSIHGSPTFRADGVVMVPNSTVSIQGNGTLDATGVQFWANRVETQGASRFLLRPDPANSVPVRIGGTRLIR